MQDNTLISDSSDHQETGSDVHNPSTRDMATVDGSPFPRSRDDTSEMDTNTSSSSLQVPSRQLRRQKATISVNTDDILTSSPVAQSTPNGLRHPSLRYSESQSHLRIPPGRRASPWTVNTDMVASESGTITPPGDRISMKRPSPNLYQLRDMSVTLSTMLPREGLDSEDSTAQLAQLAPPMMASLEVRQSSNLPGSDHMSSDYTNTGRAVHVLGVKNANAAMGQRVHAGVHQRQGLAHSSSIPARRDQRRKKTFTEDGKKETGSDLMQHDESQDELQSKDPKYDISKKRF